MKSEEIEKNKASLAKKSMLKLIENKIIEFPVFLNSFEQFERAKMAIFKGLSSSYGLFGEVGPLCCAEMPSIISLIINACSDVLVILFLEMIW